MPKNTGIKNREAYIQRLLEEDKKIAGKDSPYGRYLQSLTMLMQATNEIYAAGGKLDKDSYEKLVNRYTDAANKSVEFKEKSFFQTRRNVVNFLQKVIIRDLQALNSMDKEKPGTIDEVFEASRAMKVVIPQDMTEKVGSQNSDRFAMKTIDGKKGYFTARTDTARNREWKAIVDEIQKIGLNEEEMEVFNRLRTSHDFRQKIMDSVLFGKKIEEDHVGLVGRYMGFFGSKEEAAYELARPERQKLKAALEIVEEKSSKLLASYHMQERLGYDFYTRNDNKNAAMYEVAKLMGCEQLIAKAVPMVVVNGKKVLKGTFMEHAEGSDLGNMKANDPLWRYDANKSPFNKKLYQDLADLQVLDYICGNIDRHRGNMLYKTEVGEGGKMQLTGLVGIDNDASFPEGDISDEFRLEGRPPRIFKPQNFRFVTRKTAEFIAGMNRAQLETALRGHNLSPKAIDQAWKRAKDVKKVLEKMKQNQISYVDDLEEKSYEANDPKNPFFIDKKTAEKPSIFTGFNTAMTREIIWEAEFVKEEQRKRYEAKNQRPPENFVPKEYKEYKAAQLKEAEAKVPQAETAGKEQLLLMDLAAVKRMDTLMFTVNRLKTPTEEFTKMSTALATLTSYARTLSNKIIRKEELKDVDYKNYEDFLNELKAATSEYMEKKGMSPKTDRGRKRLDAASSFLTRSERFLSNLDKVWEKKNPEAEKTEQDVNNPEQEAEMGENNL